MAVDLPLTHDEWDLYLDALCSSHVINHRFTIYDQNEDPIGSLRAPVNRVLDGSVTMDATASISRSLELTLFDPHDKLHFVDHSAAHAALYADRYIGVHYGVYVPALDDIIYCPVFRGPLTEFSRDGYQVTIEAQGKEAHQLDPFFVTHQYELKHGMTLEEAIRNVLSRLGEQKIHLPDLSDRTLHRNHHVAAQAEPWNVIAGGKHVSGLSVSWSEHDKDKKQKKSRQTKHNVPALIRLAKHDLRLIYDSRGRVTSRHNLHNAHFVFRDGVMAQGDRRGPTVLSRPNVTYDETEVRNHWVVRGATHKGRRIEAEESLPTHHPLSPHNLGKNGEPAYMTEFITADDLKTHDECKDRARREMRKAKDAGVTVEFDALPIPFLEEGDHVRVATKGFRFDFYMNQMTLPLRAGPMNVGYTKDTSKFAHHGKH